jgi:adenylate cyclase
VGAVALVAPILAAADSGGFVNLMPDRDGTIRRYRTVASADGVTFPSLGVALLARAAGEGGAPAPVTPIAEGGGSGALRQVRAGRVAIDVDDAGRAGLAYHGSYRTFPTWSATDVLNGRIPPARMAGKIAVVGPTAPGTGDQRVTPFDRSAPGVAVHATFVENALHGELLRRTDAVLAVEAALMLALSLGLAWVFARAPSLGAVPALVLAVGAWVGLAALALARARVVLAIGVPVAQALAMFVAATTFRFAAEERERRRARETFGRFLAPAIVEEVLSERGEVRLGGEKRVLTVLFGDLRGFTSLAERLDPHALLGLLNEVLAPLTDVVVSGHEGTLDKYMGDAIMAFWGAPRGQPDHALRACRAALAMVDALAPLRAGWRGRGLPDVELGVGVNTGPVSVGFVGSEDRFYNYTVLGDAVNLASRLEGANKEYGTRILLGPATHELVKDAVVARELDLVRVKGKREPARIFELLALAPAPPDLAAPLAAFEGGLAAYRARRWDEAVALFREADRLRGGDPPSRTYLERCEAMRAAPPGPEWDGVFELRAK